MNSSTFTTDIDGEAAESIRSAARTGLGDELRSVVYFTPAQFDVLYVRQDLYESEASARDAKSPLVAFERMGFAEAPVRTALSVEGGGPSIGPYEFTVRFHQDGFVVRAIEADAGVILTTDSMNVAAFEESILTIRRLLAES